MDGKRDGKLQKGMTGAASGRAALATGRKRWRIGGEVEPGRKGKRTWKGKDRRRWENG